MAQTYYIFFLAFKIGPVKQFVRLRFGKVQVMLKFTWNDSYIFFLSTEYLALMKSVNNL